MPRTRLRMALVRPRTNCELFDLHGNDIWIRQRLYSDKSLILSSQDTVLKICKVVELAEFFGFVSVVQMTNEPIRGIPQNVLLNRAHFLSGIDEADVVFRPFLRGSNPYVRVVLLRSCRQEVVCLFDVH